MIHLSGLGNEALNHCNVVINVALTSGIACSLLVNANETRQVGAGMMCNLNTWHCLIAVAKSLVVLGP